MTLFSKKEIKACCGKKQLILTLQTVLEQEHMILFQEQGFPFLKQYFDAGMIFIEDKGLIAMGRFGSNELRIKCKNELCPESLTKLERIIEIKIK